MRPFVLLALAAASFGFDAQTGRVGHIDRPLEALLPVAAGLFTMGAPPEAQRAALRLCVEEVGPALPQACHADLFVAEGPEQKVYLGAFAIDRVEVTVGAYRACVQAGVCSPGPLLVPDQRFLGSTSPVTSVTWNEATRYCAWRGARLPSEAEWERAARGTDGRTWPWGNHPRPHAANHGRFLTSEEGSPAPSVKMRPDDRDGWAFLAPVGSYLDAASPVGALDMAGNAAEWTADIYHEEPPQRARTINPRGPALGGMRTVRGGSWRQPRLFQRTTARDGAPPDTRSPEIGFRCAR
jgi:formylglycine-generating enzyme required for sulfatase activity